MAQLLILTPRFLPRFKKQFQKLSPVLKKKFNKQLETLLKNPRHLSLRAKKMEGMDYYEARIDYHSRFVYKIVGREIWFYAIGPHDTELGKK